MIEIREEEFAALRRLADAALLVYALASQKGALYVTDEETGSDALVGFFVPAAAMNRLGRTLVDASVL